MEQPVKHADVCELTPQLWTGAELHPSDPAVARLQLDEVVAAGVDAIIDCRYERDDADWVTAAIPHMDYLYIGVEDAGWRMQHDWFDAGTNYAIDQMKDGHVVLAHCQAGINRGPSMAFAIMLATGWDALEALSHIRAARPTARIRYAEDAVDWWFTKVEAPTDERKRQVNRVRQWRRDNGLASRSNVDAH
ncbi:Dual specificity phosphatase, catalytic domain [Microbacterium laevaniformans]|uniref:Dual specificity phosphatase, catalytic domain n=1 Tax=Microbacterium laevaniformans TaxID=36807 RepID=A0A150HI96_9MICO|nr:dual specificity protein phosphatase [Microbacterium laevaniformans]KXZ61842.1 Dual specificity phosphatase, catalytic domain [Microbacterium laevaniformans]